jgi:hypothetical protein
LRSATYIHIYARISAHLHTYTSTHANALTYPHIYSCTNECTYMSTHAHASPRSNHSEHAPCTSPNTHSHTCLPGDPPAKGAAASQKKGSPMLAHHGWYLVLQPVDLVHTLSRLLMRITNTDTYMHSLARRTVSTRPNTHSRTRMHSPAAITMSLHLMQNQNTRSNTCIHRPAAMTVSVHLVQAQAHTPTHAYITLHQSQ